MPTKMNGGGNQERVYTKLLRCAFLELQWIGPIKVCYFALNDLEKTTVHLISSLLEDYITFYGPTGKYGSFRVSKYRLPTSAYIY